VSSLLLGVLLVFVPAAFASDIHDDIRFALAVSSGLKEMSNDGRQYTLPARGRKITGISDDFLRRRTPDEIVASGLSCGCGDHATAFYGEMRKRGAKVMYLDSVELSAHSLFGFDGHTGVAVEDPATKHWILVDPTEGKIVSDNWDARSKIYEDHFWIWYLGSTDDYPAHDKDSLKAAYDMALKMVPASMWSDAVVRLSFQARSSVRNPHCPAFLARCVGIYDKYGLHPARNATVVLTGAADGANEDCRKTGPREFECAVRADQNMDDGWFYWIEEYVGQHMDKRPVAVASNKASAASRRSKAAEASAKLLNFIIDGSMRSSDGHWINPYLPHFIEAHNASTGTIVKLVDGGDGIESACDKQGESWVCRIGRGSGMSDGLYAYMLRAILGR
jgi:hypothetical protein